MFFVFEQTLEIDYSIPIAFCFDGLDAFNRDKPVLCFGVFYYFFREDNFFTGEFFILRNKAEGIAEFFAVSSPFTFHSKEKTAYREDFLS
jgi:hypothetical protein